jgi:hypothetical protein
MAGSWFNGSIWDEQPNFKTDFINPIYRHGVVLVNGKLDWVVVNHIKNNTDYEPIYPLVPSSVAMYDFARVREAEIAFKVNDPTLPADPYTDNLMSSDISCPFITTFNGLGDITTGRFPDLTILGLAFCGNKNNNSDRANIHFSGVHTVAVNGDERINSGDWVYAYRPTPAEIKSQKGGLKDLATRSGRAVFWLKPYNDSIHKIHPKRIAENLIAGNNATAKGYTEAYQKMCTEISDSLLYIYISMKIHFEEFANNNADIDGVPGTGIRLNNAFTNLSHRPTPNTLLRLDIFCYDLLNNIELLKKSDNFKIVIANVFFDTKYIYRYIQQMNALPPLQQEDIDVNIRTVAQRMENVNTSLNFIKDGLHIKGAQALFYAINQFINWEAEHVIGKAYSGGNPGENIDLSLRAY